MSASLVGSEMCIRDSFIDVSSAFYVVLRPLVLAARTPDEALKALRDKGCLLYTSPSPRD
eukprot:14728892-Alexandrium_andersonii.AAC.1